ncbi:MAG TPA: bifunctional phosphopantothenoylcysteine decarboxylase/phosphopantothenate--cysteine ligase CoaBC [Smithellaceae bacterium]|jgi:phosphopantothenoylcysteine decarboxylase/phosphopantothenate--cysteine ligase|nr:bifunctional phosphopantothenoylcysteine decarboxylase/phosphopantothenate--cysteine ligase CoaBC [Syntrophaceae bacterium]MDX9815341.1 bifunctional phosphopantothenoylcysteine decarboxylase/phosphopantothenate--cysteine ligase CoaBC [Smithellaceae bacterium]OPZ51183.1 MAG: Coenzyme A biosynthesis bifunctional protein CoaBC [Deltaproteobacteria bacterium ADurb.BinA014]MBP8608910.1 bifunctional phosphopantothenoylcysteine decarboxylase/phosphopantothenate--cysteine ligase CoaBC [Syntrophaceae 
MLKKKKIVLGITGSIAAYKAAELTRALIKEGAQVKVVMTKSATEFITPLTMQTLSQNQVYLDTFVPAEKYDMAHIALADFADAFIIAPATGNIIGKIAAGVADDLLSTTIMAAGKPVLICPAMNNKMLANPIVQDNLSKLQEHGYFIMESAVGELACKTQGSGRLAEITDIIEEIKSLLTPKDFLNEKVLITAGPTQEPLDPVRFITNLSSGKMGYALATAARRRGAEVTLISGPTFLSPPKVEKIINVRTAREMHKAVMENYKKAKIIIKAAAVADYRPKEISGQKLKKTKESLTVEMKTNPDIIEEIGKNKEGRIVVGFAMETQNLLANAREKLKKKNMDLIVANDVCKEGAGFQSDTNIVTIIDKKGKTETLKKMTKLEAADEILNRVKILLGTESGRKR